MDIKDRVMGDQPNSWLHKIAGIIPGYKGYVDRERRRDADKLLRTHLAKLYTAQRDRLNRVQQSLMRAHRMDQIAEVDRLTGVFQRFIDRLNTATYGYTGMFDPVKIEAEDLDQLYAFDMALASGVDQASTAIGSIEEGVTDKEGNALTTSLDKFSQLVDDLNERLNQRSELLTSGTRMPSDQFQSMLSSLNPVPPYSQAQSTPPGAGSAETYPGSKPNMGGSTSMSTDKPEVPTKSSGSSVNLGGEMARAGGNALNTEGGAGVPTTNLGVAPYDQAEPGMSAMVDGDSSLTPMSARAGMSGVSEGPLPAGGSAGTGTESASSPASAPGAPGHDIVQGMGMANALDNVAETSSGGSDNRSPDGSR